MNPHPTNRWSGGSRPALEEAQKSFRNLLLNIDQRITEYYKSTGGRTKGLLDTKGQLSQLRNLLGPLNEGHVLAVADASTQLDAAVSTLIQGGRTLRAALKEAEKIPLDVGTGEAILLRVGEALVGYISAGRAVRRLVQQHAPALQNAQKQLTGQINVAAGTAGISLIIELLESDRKIEKRLRIAETVDGLKALKGNVDEFVTKIMLDAISGEMAKDVMDWYGRIRTVGDPDVHFAGFDMKKTAQGGRVQIKASSYGKELVSAVSSLSESKLNALGLCISIAVNLKEQSPFEFLIIDDPIQSWDRDHEVQFISIIRELVDRGKQVVLLSHNGEWIKQVRAACADLNGLYYEITGYTEIGPNIVLVPWAEPKQRLQVILAITEDQGADSIKLQQAEEELRQVIHQLACSLHEAVRGVPKNPANLSAEKVRKILTECGIATELVNKVMAAFETIDDAHHAPPGYSPNRQKLRQYYEIAVRLSQAVEAKAKENKTITLVTANKTA